MPKVSVIVPVYNMECYLSVCMDSILAQTLQDIEVICVDDGSTDQSSAILDDYAKKDSRVQVIHKKNSGYGHSMNVGMNAATGEYIGIVESDDKVLPEMYERLYNTAKDYDLDFIKSECIFWWDTINYFYQFHQNSLSEYYGRVLGKSDRQMLYKFLMNIWTGIYKKSFLELNGIRYHETPGASYQDNGFWIQTMSFAERALWLREGFYLYRQDNPTSSIKSKSKLMAMSEEYDFTASVLEARKKIYELEFCRYYKMLRHKGVFLRVSDELKRGYCKEIVKDFAKYGELTIRRKEVHDWLYRLYEDPEKFCEEFINTKKEAIQKLENAEYIIIYGAKAEGEKALRMLSYQNVSDKILCFVVSGKDPNRYIGTLPVCCIDDITVDKSRTLVVMGVRENTNAYHQIRVKLRELHFENVLDFHVMEDYFYYLK